MKHCVPLLAGISLLTGCAELQFGAANDDALTYFDAQPYLLVTVSKECALTAAAITLPAAKKGVKFHPGYGSAKLSVAISNGMITAAGQETDTKVPETLTAIAGLATAGAGLVSKPAKEGATCTERVALFGIKDGVPATTPIVLKMPPE